MLAANKEKTPNLKLKSDCVCAVIEGQLIDLPPTAKYVMQDARGSWYWSPRRPRIKEGDWTPNKWPIQPLRPDGRYEPSVIQTPITIPWTDTLQRTIQPPSLRKR